MMSLGAKRRTPKTRRRLLRWAVGVAWLAVALSACRPSARLDSARAKLVGALGPVNLAGVRFRGFAPPRAVASQARTRISASVREGLFQAMPETAWGWASRGVLRLALGRPEAAEPLFKTAVACAHGHPQFLAELGAYRLARGASGEASPAALVQGLDTIGRALALQPALVEARFNCALALQRLGLLHQSAVEWARYLDLDPRSAWSIEARRHLDEVNAQLRAGAEERGLARTRLVEAVVGGRRAEVRADVERFPEAARQYGLERLLGGWSLIATRNKVLATRLLTAAGVIGDELAAADHDFLLRDAVAAIEAARRSDAVRFDRLLQGHRRVEKGLKLERADAFGAAADQFQKAHILLAVAATPFDLVAAQQLSVCRYYEGRYAEALDILVASRARLDISRYPTAEGYSFWMSGLVRFATADFQGALADHESAGRLFTAAREYLSASYVDSLIAVDLDNLGRFDTAWAARRRSFRALPRLDDLRRVYSVLSPAAEAALVADQPAAARRILMEMLDALGHESPFGVVAETLARLAIVESRLGERLTALNNLARAHEQLALIADPAHRSRVAADLDLAAGRVDLHSAPAQAVTELTRALAAYSAAGFRVDSSLALGERAAAFRAEGAVDLAARDLAAAVADYDATRVTLSSAQARIEYYEQAQELCAQMVELQLDDRHDGEAAWRYAELARARALLDQVSPSSGTGGAPLRNIGELVGILPHGTFVIEYAVLPTRTLVWVVSSDGMSSQALPVGAAALAENVHKALAEIASGKFPAQDRTSAWRELFLQLISPLRHRLGSATALVVIPDKALRELPFSALIDPATGRYLLADYSVESAPSAAVFVQATAAFRRMASLPRSLLIVAGDRISPLRHADLPDLAGAAGEVKSVAQLYARAGVRPVTAATPRAALAMLDRCDVIQVSAHTVPDPKRPQQLAILLEPDRLGGTSARKEIGSLDLLRLEDLAASHLTHTQVAVLAGCRTARGAAFSGEGSLSLARAFLAAGVPAVIASFWDVDDMTTEKVVRVFHQGLLAGVGPLAALRLAQLAIIRNPTQAPDAPAQWAAFELIGGIAAPRQVTEKRRVQK